MARGGRDEIDDSDVVVLHRTARDPLQVGLLCVTLCMVLVLSVLVGIGAAWLLARQSSLERTNQDLHRSLEEIRKINPGEGEFDALKWRVDELRAIHSLEREKGKP